MKSIPVPKVEGLRKTPTGIPGLDETMRGGLPVGRTTLIEGGAGSGKTILALQSLMRGIREQHEPGIFVAFEETPGHIIENVASFNWGLSEVRDSELFFLDAKPQFDLAQSGDFDLSGMLAVLDAKVAEMSAKRIVFDSIDIVMSLLDNPHAVRREMNRLHEWLLEKKLTAILTHKMRDSHTGATSQSLDFLRFMTDCSIVLSHKIDDGVSQRSLHIAKYRGSSFEENEVPFVFGPEGFQVGYFHELSREPVPASLERISSGIARLDTMLGGGYYRSSSILITGAPGTAKTTLCGAFAEAACRRGERTLFISFDSDGDEITRNLASVNIQLAPHLENKMLHLRSERSFQGSPEVHLIGISAMAAELGAQCVIVDPLSALAKSGTSDLGYGVIDRLVHWAKSRGITLMCTSLLDQTSPGLENNAATPVNISTIADAWIHLNYLICGGERNRGLSIVKSRGTSHSNQVREVLMSGQGVFLEDVFSEGGAVLMGTLRFEKEQAVKQEQYERAAHVLEERKRLASEANDMELQLTNIRNDLEQTREALAALDDASKAEEQTRAWTRRETQRRRASDADPKLEDDGR